MASTLFSPLTIRELTLKNRIAVSPMCQYSSDNGFANDWHLVHLGSRAAGGAALVFTEAAAVEPIGRISPQDLGIYLDQHVEFLSRITAFVETQGAAAGIQIAHAGRKASTASPWNGGKAVPAAEGGWTPAGPGTDAFDVGYAVPAEMTTAQIEETVSSFGHAALRSLEAGFKVVEIHGAHGYLLHSFCSALSNHRADAYGGDFAGRTRIVREVVQEVRRHWPERLPLFLRISSTDWTPGGWDIEQSVQLARDVGPLGVDLIDASSGGNVPHAPIPVAPGYQTPFAAQIRREAHILTGAVGMVTSPVQAEHLLQTGQADMVLLAREMLRDPYWPRRAAAELKSEITPPVQYQRAW